MNSNAIKHKNKKQKLWTKYTLSRRDTDYVNFVKCKNELRSVIRKLRKKFEISLASRSKSSPKMFWSYVKSRLKTRTRIPTLKNSNGTVASTPREKAEALNNYFGSVYKQESSNLPNTSSNDTRTPLSSLDITDEMVMKKLNSLDPGKSMGLDGCHPYFLYSLRDVLCAPLRILYNKSLKEGVVATQWLEACITAIHKKGPKNLASNYRLISITSVICKMVESIIRDHIVVHMSDNNLFANEQHGFVPRRECMTNLLSAMEDWSEAIELGLDTDVIYTDFAKAFDSVPHKRLSLKLKANGIEGDVLKWIRSFLTGRSHSVCRR